MLLINTFQKIIICEKAIHPYMYATKYSFLSIALIVKKIKAPVKKRVNIANAMLIHKDCKASSRLNVTKMLGIKMIAIIDKVLIIAFIF
jgi:hypothetical protein